MSGVYNRIKKGLGTAATVGFFIGGAVSGAAAETINYSNTFPIKYKDNTVVLVTKKEELGTADYNAARAVFNHPVIQIDDSNKTEFAELLNSLNESYHDGKLNKVYIIGGGVAVNATVEQTLNDVGLNTKRIAGDTRDETSVELAKAYIKQRTPVEKLVLLNGTDHESKLIEDSVNKNRFVLYVSSFLSNDTKGFLEKYKGRQVIFGENMSNETMNAVLAVLDDLDADGLDNNLEDRLRSDKNNFTANIGIYNDTATKGQLIIPDLDESIVPDLAKYLDETETSELWSSGYQPLPGWAVPEGAKGKIKAVRIPIGLEDVPHYNSSNIEGLFEEINNTSHAEYLVFLKPLVPGDFERLEPFLDKDAVGDRIIEIPKNSTGRNLLLAALEDSKFYAMRVATTGGVTPAVVHKGSTLRIVACSDGKTYDENRIVVRRALHGPDGGVSAESAAAGEEGGGGPPGGGGDDDRGPM